MDKDKFMEWLESKTTRIIDENLDIAEKNPCAKHFLQGSVTAMEEILKQVKSGKFDK